MRWRTDWLPIQVLLGNVFPGQMDLKLTVGCHCVLKSVVGEWTVGCSGAVGLLVSLRSKEGERKGVGEPGTGKGGPGRVVQIEFSALEEGEHGRGEGQ